MSNNKSSLGGYNMLGKGFKDQVSEASLPKDDIKEVGGTAKGVTSGGAAPKGPAKMDRANYGAGGDKGVSASKGKGQKDNQSKAVSDSSGGDGDVKEGY